MANLTPTEAAAGAALEAAARREPCARVRVRMLAVRHLLARAQVVFADGHSAGDAVLREVAERCRRLLRTSDLVVFS